MLSFVSEGGIYVGHSSFLNCGVQDRCDVGKILETLEGN